MSDEIRINRPAQQQPMARHEQGNQSSMNDRGDMQQPAPSSKTPWIILGVIVVLLIIGGLVFRKQLFGMSGGSSAMMSSTDASQQSSGYQAVFLTNGQVYFGKLSNPDSDYPTLTDIFYLQVGPQQGSGTAAGSTSTASQSISLVKLGNELHGPVDEMHIAKGQILFYEDMKESSQVVQAIKNYKASQAATPTPTPTAAQ